MHALLVHAVPPHAVPHACDVLGLSARLLAHSVRAVSQTVCNLRCSDDCSLPHHTTPLGLRAQALTYMRPKMHALLLDSTINSPSTVRLNIYQVGVRECRAWDSTIHYQHLLLTVVMLRKLVACKLPGGQCVTQSSNGPAVMSGTVRQSGSAGSAPCTAMFVPCWHAPHMSTSSLHQGTASGVRPLAALFTSHRCVALFATRGTRDAVPKATLRYLSLEPYPSITGIPAALHVAASSGAKHADAHLCHPCADHLLCWPPGIRAAVPPLSHCGVTLVSLLLRSCLTLGSLLSLCHRPSCWPS